MLGHWAGIPQSGDLTAPQIACCLSSLAHRYSQVSDQWVSREGVTIKPTLPLRTVWHNKNKRITSLNHCLTAAWRLEGRNFSWKTSYWQPKFILFAGKSMKNIRWTCTNSCTHMKNTGSCLYIFDCYRIQHCFANCFTPYYLHERR